MPDLILKQLVATVDERTTSICLFAAGQVRKVDEPYDTLNGRLDRPPFHTNCRSMSVPWMRGMTNEQTRAASQQIRNAPKRIRQEIRNPQESRLPPVPVRETSIGGLQPITADEAAAILASLE